MPYKEFRLYRPAKTTCSIIFFSRHDIYGHHTRFRNKLHFSASDIPKQIQRTRLTAPNSLVSLPPPLHKLRPLLNLRTNYLASKSSVLFHSIVLRYITWSWFLVTYRLGGLVMYYIFVRRV